MSVIRKYIVYASGANVEGELCNTVAQCGENLANAFERRSYTNIYFEGKQCHLQFPEGNPRGG